MPELGHKPLIAIMLGDVDFMLTASDFGDWPHLGSFWLRFHCACAEMAICVLPVKIQFNSLTMISL